MKCKSQRWSPPGCSVSAARVKMRNVIISMQTKVIADLTGKIKRIDERPVSPITPPCRAPAFEKALTHHKS